MKKILFAGLIFSVSLSGCKVIEKLKKSDEQEVTVEAENPETKVFSVPAEKPAKRTSTVRNNPTSDKMYETPKKSEKPVRIQSETFTFDKQEDRVNNEGNTYFVIIGSFSSNDNANRYKQELIPQGFRPIVLRSETGYFRVCVNSFTDEAEARNRVYQIRSDYPKYADTWLLIKK